MDPPTTAGTAAHAATLAAAAAAYLRVFDPLDAKAILPILGDSYRHEFAPASLDPPPALDAPGFDAHLARMRRMMRSFPVREIRSWPNPSLNQVVVWARPEAFFHDRIVEGGGGGPGEWTVRSEYMWVITMDGTGERVEHVLEFLDSKTTEQLRALIAKAFKRLEELDGDGSREEPGGWNFK